MIWACLSSEKAIKNKDLEALKGMALENWRMLSSCESGTFNFYLTSVGIFEL